MITVSIITVCYNAGKTIESTLQSVLGQTYQLYEYIIVDGQSTDVTNQIIQKYIPLFANRGIRVKYVSEKDEGIYYAMNKAVAMAEGVWVAFMNADDSYYNDTILEDIFADERYLDYDVIYGSTNFISENNSWIEEPYDLDVLRNRVAFAHQSGFVKTEIMKEKLFDVDYKYAADYQLFLELWLENKRFKRLENRIVSNFSMLGLSTVKAYASIAELRKIRFMHRIPGNCRGRDFIEYIWWVAVHLGGLRDVRANRVKKRRDIDL